MDYKIKKEELIKKFEDTEKEKNRLLGIVKQLEIEELKLQGEYRLVEEIIQELEKKEVKPVKK